MTRRITRHPTDPTPDQGAITVWAEREHAVSAFRLSAPAGSIELLDLDLREPVPAPSPASVEDFLGPVVFPDLAAYRRSSAWRLATVLEQLGLDAGELAEVELDDAETEDGPAFEGELPYDFAHYPPDYEPRAVASSKEVFEAVSEQIQGAIKAMEIEGGRALLISEKGEAALTAAALRVLEARWPGRYLVKCVFQQGELAIQVRIQVEPAEHLEAWTRFMADHDPRGYTFMGVGGQVEWVCEAHKTRGICSFYSDARAAAWTDLRTNDAAVIADLLAMAGLWPEDYQIMTGRYEAASGPEIEPNRIAWILGWSLLERGLAGAWAAATHLAASDNDDVEIPPRPACLDRERPA